MRGFLFLFLFALGGCASIDPDDYRQTVLILTDPPGAKIYDQGNLVGVSPGYVRLRRGRKPEIKLLWEDHSSRQVRLKTKYRWDDSFGMNWLFLSLAPAGWIVDYLTGTAWDVEDPPLQTLEGKPSEWPTIVKPQRVAVAPPEGVDADTADALGLAINDKLHTSEKFTVLDYAETSPTFRFFRGYNGLPQDKEDRYRLFSTLKVDHVLISRAEEKGDHFLVTAELKDVVTTHTASTYNWDIRPRDPELQEEFSTRTFINRYFRFLPNTVFLNFASYTPTIGVDGYTYRGKEGPAGNFGEEFGRYLSALSIAGVDRDQFNTRGHFTFSFVPTAILSQKQIVFPSYGPANEAKFRRWYLGGGYGIEGGYMGRFGLVYVDFIPMLTWSSIKYENPDYSNSLSRFSLQTFVEMGYSIFITEHLIARIYFRNVSEDTTLWDKALTEAGGGSSIVTNSVSSGFAGISIGYYIPTSFQRRDGWLVRKTTRH